MLELPTTQFMITWESQVFNTPNFSMLPITTSASVLVPMPMPTFDQPLITSPLPNLITIRATQAPFNAAPSKKPKGCSYTTARKMHMFLLLPVSTLSSSASFHPVPFSGSWLNLRINRFSLLLKVWKNGSIGWERAEMWLSFVPFQKIVLPYSFPSMFQLKKDHQ